MSVAHIKNIDELRQQLIGTGRDVAVAADQNQKDLAQHNNNMIDIAMGASAAIQREHDLRSEAEERELQAQLVAARGRRFLGGLNVPGVGTAPVDPHLPLLSGQPPVPVPPQAPVPAAPPAQVAVVNVPLWKVWRWTWTQWLFAILFGLIGLGVAFWSLTWSWFIGQYAALAVYGLIVLIWFVLVLLAFIFTGGWIGSLIDNRPVAVPAGTVATPAPVVASAPPAAPVVPAAQPVQQTVVMPPVTTP